MNLVKKIKELDVKVENEFYENLTQFFDIIEQLTTATSEILIRSIDDNMNNINTKEDLNNLINKYCTINNNTVINYKITKKNKEIKLELNKMINLICLKKLEEVQYSINSKYKTAKIYVNSLNDMNLLNKKRLFTINKYCLLIKSFKIELFDNYLEDMNEFLNNYINEIFENKNLNKILNNEQFEISEEDLNDKRIQKIFNYKNIEKLAIKNGYKYKWSNGDHKIYEHKDLKTIIVIPAHTLGLGLSIKIQKQIYGIKKEA